MPFEIVGYLNRNLVFTGNLLQSDGVTGQALNPLDRVRVKIGRGTGAPVIDLTSAAPSSNGSTVTITSRGAFSPPVAASISVEITAADMALLSQGPQDVELIAVDSTDGYSSKQVDVGVLHVMADMGGALG